MAKIKLNVSATIEETFKDFMVSRKTKGLADKTLDSYEHQFRGIEKCSSISITHKYKIGKSAAVGCVFLIG